MVACSPNGSVAKFFTLPLSIPQGGQPRLRIWLQAGLIGLLLGQVPSAAARALCPANLPEAVATVTTRPELQRARLGMQVETASGEVLYSRQGDRFFLPASTLKLLTTAAALRELGPDYRIRTVVQGHPTRTALTPLRVVGGGDPSLDGAALDQLAAALAQQGIRQVSTLIGDESALAGNWINPNWEWEDVQAGYGAPVNPLIFNQNAISLQLIPQAVGQPLQVVWADPARASVWSVENRSRTVPVEAREYISLSRDLGQPRVQIAGQLRVGAAPETVAIAVPNPGEAFLAAFRQALTQHNIAVGTTALTRLAAAAPLPELAAVQSPPLSALLRTTNQDSNNLYAEALLKQLGRNADETDATHAGIERALASLQDLGLDPADVVMVDGSGLARKNLITPAALVTVLQGMARSPEAAIYRDSLAVAGVSGTLRARLQDTPAAGRLWGKSGAVSRNFALAGYLNPPNHEPLAFAIAINNIDAPGYVARDLIDALVVTLARLEPCL